MRDMRPNMFVKRGGASCVQVARTLQRYLDGELDEHTRAHVAGHLQACRRCGLDAQAYREIKTALARHSNEIPDAPVERLRAFAAQIADGTTPSDASD